MKKAEYAPGDAVVRTGEYLSRIRDEGMYFDGLAQPGTVVHVTEHGYLKVNWDGATALINPRHVEGA